MHALLIKFIYIQSNPVITNPGCNDHFVKTNFLNCPDRTPIRLKIGYNEPLIIVNFWFSPLRGFVLTWFNCIKENKTRKWFINISKKWEMYIPVMGLAQATHLFAKSSPKQSAQYGLSSLDVKRWPARQVLQLVQQKHSLCQGSFRYVTPPLVIICNMKKYSIIELY